jgi:hypothetical protein
MLPLDVALRLKKGSKKALSTTTIKRSVDGDDKSSQVSSDQGDSEVGGGFRLSEEWDGLVVAHHGTRVTIERIEEEYRGEQM